MLNNGRMNRFKILALIRFNRILYQFLGNPSQHARPCKGIEPWLPLHPIIQHFSPRNPTARLFRSII